MPSRWATSIAEMMDIEHTVANVRRNSPHLDPQVLPAIERHLRDHHLSTRDVGMLAQRAGVGGVIVTHFVGKEPGEPGHFEYLRRIGEHFAGPVTIAADLDMF
jgi:ribonuclease BN (tRNA processing enzyme)